MEGRLRSTRAAKPFFKGFLRMPSVHRLALAASASAIALLAAAVAFLASDEAAFVTGTVLFVDGGRLARI